MPYTAEVYFFYMPGCPWCEKFHPVWDAVVQQLPAGTRTFKIDVTKSKERHRYRHPQHSGVPQVAFVVGKMIDWHMGYTSDPKAVVMKLMAVENLYMQQAAEAAGDTSTSQQLRNEYHDLTTA